MDDDDDGNLFQFDPSVLTEEQRRDIDIEGMQLAEGRVYLVLKPCGEGSVSVRCYDTTEEGDITGAHVLIKGLMATLEDEYEAVMDRGHQEIIYELTETVANKPNYSVSNNIIKIDFSGRKDN